MSEPSTGPATPPLVESEVLAASLRWVSGIVLVLTIAVGVGGVLALGFHPRHIVANVLVVGLVGVTQALVRAGRVRLAAHIFLFVLWSIISVWVFRVGGSHSPILLTYFPVIVITAVLMSRRVGLVYSALSAGVVGVLLLAEARGLVIDDPFTAPLRYVISAASLFMTGGVIYLAARLREEATERALAGEREHARLTERFHQAQKLESIGLLAGGVAHDFNNLLTVIQGNVERLKPYQAGAKERAILDEVDGAAQRAADLTRQLLAFGGRQVLHPRNISVSDVVEGLRNMLGRVLSEDIELRFDLRATGIVRADAGQLEQVLVNLAVNARDAMPKGGVLGFSTTDVQGPLGEIVPPGRFVALTIEDNGLGMAPDVAARVFEPFFTTKPVGQGTGLGLAVVDGIVRQSGGTINVETAIGRGTRFELFLPRVDAVQADPLPIRPPSSVAAGGGTVLLIEDEAPLRQVLASSLEEGGFTVLAVADGEEALRLVESDDPRIDVVVTDVVMPRMRGPEAVERLRRRYPGLRALFISGHAGPSVEGVAAEFSGSAFLGKPFRPADLTAAVRDLLARPDHAARESD